MKRTATLRRYTPMNKRRKGPPRRGRVLDPEYLAWLREQPCIVPGCTSHLIEAAHCGLRGFGAKSHDREALPMCGIGHHREGPESQEKLGRRFWSFHNLDRDELIRRFNEQYEAWRQAA